MAKEILIGNTFPLSLVRRKVVIEPIELEELKKLLQQSNICSFWGHSNTLAVARELLGIDITPPFLRPVLELSADKKPLFNGKEFSECYLLSPDYQSNFRPAPGEEVTQEQIKSWQCLKVVFSDRNVTASDQTE